MRLLHTYECARTILVPRMRLGLVLPKLCALDSALTSNGRDDLRLVEYQIRDSIGHAIGLDVEHEP